MRNWIEKLGKVSKERGTFICFREIKIANFSWNVYEGFDPKYMLTIKEFNDKEYFINQISLKIYQDEYDYLFDIYKTKFKNYEDNLIAQIENL
jgi:hypothetical protein